MKVFCIGFNKTGTMSLHEYFTLAGLDSSHDATYQKKTRTMARDELRAYLDAHDAFSDGERANYRLLFEMYPEARFILNTRGLKQWLESRVKHVFRQGGAALVPPAAWNTDGSVTDGDPLDRPRPGYWSGPMAREYLDDPERAISDWIDRREFYHRTVIEFFTEAQPRHFRTVNVSRGSKWQSDLDDFLGVVTNGERKTPIHENTASANMAIHSMEQRLHQVELVLVQKSIPSDEWENETYIGDRTSRT